MKSFDDEVLSLDNQLCFRLYAASRLVTQLYRKPLEALGVTYPQYLVLLALWQWELDGDTEPKTVSRISQRLLLDAGTVTPLLRRMETAGLLVRRKGAEDGREVHIALTRQGRALKKRAPQVPMSLLCMPGLPHEELPALLGALTNLLQALGAANDDA
jgi:MarR family transcriptional regulator, organic hydroperoxide resistance regulator